MTLLGARTPGWSFAKTMGFSMFCAWDIAQTMVFPWFCSLGFAKTMVFKVLRQGLRQNLGFSMFLDIKTHKGAFKDQKKKKKRWVWGSSISSLAQLVPAVFLS